MSRGGGLGRSGRVSFEVLHAVRPVLRTAVHGPLRDPIYLYRVPHTHKTKKSHARCTSQIAQHVELVVSERTGMRTEWGRRIIMSSEVRMVTMNLSKELLP